VILGALFEKGQQVELDQFRRPSQVHAYQAWKRGRQDKMEERHDSTEPLALKDDAAASSHTEVPVPSRDPLISVASSSTAPGP
jgi:hypothetical protein